MGFQAERNGQTNSAADHVMSTTFEKKLVELLQDETAALKKLKNNLKRQYEVLLQQNLNDFWAVLEEQKSLIQEIQKMEYKRESELRDLLPQLENLSLKELIGRNCTNYREQLFRLKNEFDHLVGEVNSLKKTNRDLITQSLEMVQKQIAFLRSFEQRNYTATGKEEPNHVSYLNRRV